MRSPGMEDSSVEPSVRSKTSLRSYTSIFKKRMTKKSEMNSRLKLAKATAQEHYQSDNASLLPRPSDVGTMSADRRSRYRVRRDIQSHIPDWIDDVVHAQLIQIARRLGEEEVDEDGGDGWTPPQSAEFEQRTDTPMDEALDEAPGKVSEEAQDEPRPGSAPEASRDDVHKDAQSFAITRRSSVSAPSSRAMSLLGRGARSLVSPVDEITIGPIAFSDLAAVEEVETKEPRKARRSRNLSSASGNSALSQGTATSNYSKLSSATSPGTSADKRISDTLSTHMTWTDIAKKNPIKKPVEAGVMKKVNTHLAKPSTTYSIMSPVNAGVFDDSASQMSKSSASKSIQSPAQARSFEDENANLNKPLPPDPKLKAAEKRTTFFVVGDVVHSPRTPQSPRLPRSSTYPQGHPTLHSLHGTPSPKSPRYLQSPKSSSSPKLPHSAQLPIRRVEDRPEGMTHKQFARLSRPFSEPVFDFADMPPSPGLPKWVESPAQMTPELQEKFLVIEEEEEPVEGAAEQKPTRIMEDSVLEEPVDHSSILPKSVTEPIENEVEPVTQTPSVEVRSLSPIAEVASPAAEPSEEEALGLGITGLDHGKDANASEPTPAESDIPVRSSSALSHVSLSVSSAELQTPNRSRSASPVPVQQIVIHSPSRPSTPVEASSGPAEAVNPVESVDTVVESDPVEAPLDTRVEVVSETAPEEEVIIVNDAPEEFEEVDSPIAEDEAEYSEDDLSGPPSPTLSQAENDLIAQLDLDTSVKFIRDSSWLADGATDSPTLGRGIPSLRVEEVRPATALGNEICAAEENTDDVRIDEVRPATALGNEMAREGAKPRKKTESHYEFVWSPEDGWYVA